MNGARPQRRQLCMLALCALISACSDNEFGAPMPINDACDISERSYCDALTNNGIETEFIEDPNVGHAWLSTAPDEMSAWFVDH